MNDLLAGVWAWHIPDCLRFGQNSIVCRRCQSEVLLLPSPCIAYSMSSTSLHHVFMKQTSTCTSTFKPSHQWKTLHYLMAFQPGQTGRSRHLNFMWLWVMAPGHRTFDLPTDVSFRFRSHLTRGWTDWWSRWMLRESHDPSCHPNCQRLKKLN